MDMKVTIIQIVIGTFVTVTKGLLKGPTDLEVGWRGRDHPNDIIIENGQNTEKSPGDLRILAVTQIPMKSHQRTLIKNSQGVNNNDRIAPNSSTIERHKNQSNQNENR